MLFWGHWGKVCNFLKKKFIYLFILFLTALGLPGFARASSRCGVWASHWRGCSCCRAGALGAQASVAAAHRCIRGGFGLWSTDPAAVPHGLSFPSHVGSSPTRDKNPYLMHWQADAHPLHHQRSPYVIFYYPQFHIKETQKMISLLLKGLNEIYEFIQYCQPFTRKW